MKVKSKIREIDISDATASLADHARQATDKPLVVTEKGKPVAMLVSLEGGDWESLSLSLNPTFLAILGHSQWRLEHEGGISADEVRRRLGVPSRKKARAKPATP